MTSATLAGPTASAAAAAARALAEHSPDLVDAFTDNLPRAVDVVDRRVVSACHRERLGVTTGGEIWSGNTLFVPDGDGRRLQAWAARHTFNRIEVTQPLTPDPTWLLRELTGSTGDVTATAAELTDATVNLAIAYARRDALAGRLMAQGTGAADSLDLVAGLDADTQALFFERLSTEGHNLHPCGRTRIGWSVADLLAHDLETDATSIGFVGVRRSVHIGDDVGRVLADLPVDPARYAVTPVHAWQLRRVVRGRYADLVTDGTLVPLEVTLPAQPTAALRTLLLAPGPDGHRGYVKVSLDIQVASTRRTISVASTRNGAVLSALLASLLDSDRVLLLAETGGCAAVAPGGRERDLASILRSGLSTRLSTDEIPVPGSGLYATSPVTAKPVVAELVDRYAATRGHRDPATAALGFVDEYARLLLPPVLALATRYGIGLEAHLQNCVPTFVAGIPHRLALRDFAGLRVFPGRLAHPPRLWPGSVIVTNDVNVMRSKVAYTALQAHLGELVIRLVDSHGLAESAAWAAVRRVVDEVYDDLRTDPTVTVRAAADHAFLTAPTVPHKALLSMRLAAGRGQGGDIYVPVENPLR